MCKLIMARPRVPVTVIQQQREWNGVREDVAKSTVDSEEGKSARSKILTQEVVDSLVPETLPLGDTKEIPMKAPTKAKRPWGFTKAMPNKEDGEEAGKTPLPRRSERQPLLTPLIESSEVKRRTGFTLSLELIAYVITICNRAMDCVRKRNSSMPWFEEWFFFFERTYGQTCRRQIDIVKIWGMSHNHLNQIQD